jgi:AcrR family transcriptional regulator
MAKSDENSVDLKEACAREAHRYIAEHGIESLSLREIARRLGVSHQAPYKHYPNRDYLLAEVIRRCFRKFAEALDARQRHEDPECDLESMGGQYLAFALSHPLEYRLMFGTPWPAVAQEAGLTADAVHAFDVLRGVLRRLHGSGRGARQRVDLDAMFIWSTMHGLSTITQSNVMPHLNLPRTSINAVPEHVMGMIGTAMQAAMQAGGQAVPNKPQARARRSGKQ